jgi:hypothetical protein
MFKFGDGIFSRCFVFSKVVGEEDSMRNSSINFENNMTRFCEKNATIMNPCKNIINLLYKDFFI